MQNQSIPKSKTYHHSSPKLANGRAPNNKRRRFESFVEELKLYIETHGHMNVTKQENKSLHIWIRNIRSSYKRIQEGRKPITKLTEERMKVLQQIDFEFESRTRVCVPFGSRIKALRLYQARHGHIRVSAKEDKSLNTFMKNVRQSVKCIQQGGRQSINITLDRITTLEEIGFHIRSKENDQQLPQIESFVEEIEGDIIPRWLISDANEEDNTSNSLLDEVSIKIEGGTEVS